MVIVAVLGTVVTGPGLVAGSVPSVPPLQLKAVEIVMFFVPPSVPPERFTVPGEEAGRASWRERDWFSVVGATEDKKNVAVPPVTSVVETLTAPDCVKLAPGQRPVPAPLSEP